MKILWIYKYSASYNFDKWFHLEYVRWMKKNGVDIVVYGPDIYSAYPDLVKIQWNKDITWDRLVKETKADIVILNTKSRMFDYYSPHTKTSKGCILPIGFAESKIIPKIMIEEDYHYETDDDWYQEVGINVILQRHYSQSLRSQKVKMLWHPFSVDENIFKPQKEHRINKICFAGNMTSAYPDRQAICNELKKRNIIDIFEGKRINNDYVHCLQDYVAHISTSSIYDICAAKNLEIMSSGSALMTNKFSGIDLLFPKTAYCEINKDGSDAVEKAAKILSDKEYVNFTVQEGLKCIKENHTNKIRTEQLLEILRSYI